jgi:hypothetical protein
VRRTGGRQSRASVSTVHNVAPFTSGARQSEAVNRHETLAALQPLRIDGWLGGVFVRIHDATAHKQITPTLRVHRIVAADPLEGVAAFSNEP